MKAVFFEKDRIENIGTVLASLPSDTGKNKKNHAANFLDSSLPVSVREEVSIAVRCAMIAAIFSARTNGNTSLPPSLTIEKAVNWFNQLPLDPVELTLLGFAAVYHLLHVLVSDTHYLSSSESSSSSSSSPVPGQSASSADDEADNAQHAARERAQSLNFPNLGRVASELMYWARNAYNPAFYGFTSELVEVVEKECTSLCQSAGVDVADYTRVRDHKVKTKRRRHRRSKKRGRQSADGSGKQPSVGQADCDQSPVVPSSPVDEAKSRSQKDGSTSACREIPPILSTLS